MINEKLLNVVVYSKDRPMQLQLLLETYIDCNKGCLYGEDNVTIIYKASNEEYQKGYNEVISFHNCLDFKFIKEKDFKQETLSAIDQEYKYTMFLMDDIIFYKPFSFNDEPFTYLDKYPDGVLAVSLRLSSQTNYCYPISKEQLIPNFHKKCAWRWVEADGDFGYPMSLDGNVFNTNKILEILYRIQDDKFTHPNLLEGALNDFAQTRKFAGTIPQIMTCYPESSRLFNNPCNRVQDLVHNKNENTLNPQKLNEIFLEGKSFNILETLKDIKDGNKVVNAAHFPITMVINNND